MAEFRFKIVDADGERRTGTVNAENYGAAKAALVASSSSILELEEVSSYLPGPQLSDNPGTRLWVGLCATISLVFFLSLAAALFGGKDERRRIAKPTMETINLTVTGKLATRPIHDVRIHAILPELPLEVQAELQEDDQTFEFPVEIRSSKRPARIILELSQQGERWQADVKNGVGLTGTVDFGSVPYAPPEIKVRPYRKPRMAYRPSANPKADLEREKAERIREREQWRRESGY